MTKENKNTETEQCATPVVMRRFSLEEMRQAFNAGKELIWEDLEQTTMCSKYESFEEWLEIYALTNN